MAQKSNSKKLKATTVAWLMVVLVLAIAIPLNLLASRLDVSWDMTPSRLYSLTDDSKNYLKSLEDEGTVVDFYILVDMDELKNSDDDLALYNTLMLYKSYDCINFHSFDPDEEPEKVDLLNPDGLFNLTTGDMVVKYGDVMKKIPSSRMYTFNGSYDDNGDFVTDSAYFNGENYITGAIKSAVTGVTPTVYFLTGHGEKSLDENYSMLKANLSNFNYNAAELDLSKTPKIPEDTALLAAAAPTEDFSDQETAVINSYLDEGGNIIFMMNPSDKEMRFTNIEAILERFAIAMDYDRVKETNTALCVDGDPYTIQCNLTEVTEEEDSTETESVDGYIDIGSVNSHDTGDVDLTSALLDNGTYTFMPESRSFYPVYNENYTNVSMNSLITANTSAVGEPYGGTSDDPDDVKDDSTGLILSMYSMDNSSNEAKTVVFGSADFVTDESLKSDYFINPVYLLLSSVSWMYSNEIDMGIAAKSNTYDTIEFANEAEAKQVMVLFVAIPVVVAIAGVVVWLRRRNA